MTAAEAATDARIRYPPEAVAKDLARAFLDHAEGVAAPPMRSVAVLDGGARVEPLIAANFVDTEPQAVVDALVRATGAEWVDDA
jgi:hypothetical protein